MDIKPHQFVSYVINEDIESLVKSKSLWKCLSCFACVERCPRDVKPGKLIDAARQIVVRERGNTYLDPDEIPELMDKCMEYLGKLKSTSGQQEPDSAAFKLSLECGASTSRVVTGTYNRRGLPEGWDAFIREIAGYIRFYESYEDILNPYIYRRGRRQGEQIICSVVFHEKGEKHPYLTEDEHLEVGDKVLVQAGPYKQELPGKIVSIDYYRKEDLPEEMGDIGEILKKIEE